VKVWESKENAKKYGYDPDKSDSVDEKEEDEESQ
jgi:hypothetical protein